MHQKQRKGFFVLSLLSLPILLIMTVMLTGAENAYGGNANGEEIYKINCAVCHGVKGDSKGEVCYNTNVEKSGKEITTYSRDFTLGVFKFRTTATGCLPDENDLKRIISTGIPKSFMPSFNDISPEEKMALIEYVESFSERWEEEDPCDVITTYMPNWVGKSYSVEKGKKIYQDMKCWECHGDKGDGAGPKADKLKDDWGHKMVPFDFTSGALKRGTAPEDIYITFTTGLDGTGMPSYEDTLGEDDRWHLVSYTLKLMGR